MHFFHSCIVFLSILASTRPCDPDSTPAPVKAKVSLSSGDLHLFSEENVQLICTVPDDLLSDWEYKWFFGESDELFGSSQVFDLTKAQVQQGGEYTCEGKKATKCWPYEMKTIQSDPISVEVDGGWVFLRVPHEPIILNDDVTLTCRIRNNPKISEVVFYKEGVEIQRSVNKYLVLENVMMHNMGEYSCHATWLQGNEYQAAQSQTTSVKVLDKLTTPIIEFLTGHSRLSFREGKKAELRCITQINAREPGLSIEYYFMKDDERLGPASSSEIYLIPQVSKEDSGNYTCRVRVRALNLERLSKEPAELIVKS